MKNQRLFPSSLAVVGLVCGVAAAQDRAAPATDAVRTAIIEHLGLEDAVIVSVPTSGFAVGADFAVELPVGPRGERHDVRFQPNSVRSVGYEVVEDRGDLGLFAIDAGPSRTVAGDAPTLPGATIRGSLLDDGLHAVFRWADDRIQWIEPVGKFVDGFDDSLHVLYDNDWIPPVAGSCGTPAPILGRDVHGPPAPEAVMLGGAVFCAELACDADWEYYQDYGQNSSNVQNRIELIINTCNGQYESQVAIRHEITQILIRTTSSDPYTSSEATTLLCQFITEWTNNQASVPRDVAHLFTGRSINGGTIGIAADLGDICDNNGGCSGPILYDGAYCLSESDCCGSLGCATDLTTHELGHLWDAFHCSCPSNTMNPSITCSNSFSSGTINSIISHRDSRSCLDVCDGGGGGPGGYCAASCSDLTYEFIASVVSSDLGIARTSGSNGYADYTGDVGVASPGDSVSITVTNGDPQWVDDIFAIYIDWNADEDFEDPGENPVLANGVGPYEVGFTVPADQPLGDTRMRLRVHDGGFDAMAPCGTASYGEVEDYTLRIEAGAPPCVGDINGDGSVDAADLGLLVGAWGACGGGGCPADLNGDGRVDAADLGLLVGAWGACS